MVLGASDHDKCCLFKYIVLDTKLYIVQSFAFLEYYLYTFQASFYNELVAKKTKLFTSFKISDDCRKLLSSHAVLSE